MYTISDIKWKQNIKLSILFWGPRHFNLFHLSLKILRFRWKKNGSLLMKQSAYYASISVFSLAKKIKTINHYGIFVVLRTISMDTWTCMLSWNWDRDNLAKRNGIRPIEILLLLLRLSVLKQRTLTTWRIFQSVKKAMSQQRDVNLTDEAIN